MEGESVNTPDLRAAIEAIEGFELIVVEGGK